MLFNPNWTKSKNVHSVASLIAWLATKNPAERYRYASCKGCMLAQYYQAMGFNWVAVTPRTLQYGLLRSMNLPKHFDRIASRGEPTFGAALERALVCL